MSRAVRAWFAVGGWMIACAAAVPMATRAQAPASARPPDTSAGAVVARAVSYLTEYKETLQFVLADEVTVQEVFNWQGKRAARRETSGEFFLTYLAADGGWIGVRDIANVDGVPVENRDNLRELLNRGSFARIGRQLADRNSRYNIGSVGRNFNDPMLALFILDDTHRRRFKFDRRRVTPTSTGPLVTVAFTERDRPTLVRGTDGAQVFAKGEFVIDASTGQIRRSVITLKVGPTEASLTTVFTENGKLALWLPALFTETYDHATRRLTERVVAESAYTNYRRFNVNVVIK